jgi:hypothetical protein
MASDKPRRENAESTFGTSGGGGGGANERGPFGFT